MGVSFYCSKAVDLCKNKFLLWKPGSHPICFLVICQHFMDRAWPVSNATFCIMIFNF